MKKALKRTLLALGAVAMTVGFSLPAHAHSATVCVEAHVNIAGTPVDVPETCQTLPPAAP